MMILFVPNAACKHGDAASIDAGGSNSTLKITLEHFIKLEMIVEVGPWCEMCVEQQTIQNRQHDDFPDILSFQEGRS
jgi:hypothetical protein